MARTGDAPPTGPVIAGPGSPAIRAAGASLVVHEWTDPGPSYLHVHRSDDEAWHVLEGALRFRFPGREVDAPAGTTVFVPAGSPHTYRVAAPGSRYLIFLTPRLDRLIAKLRTLPAGSDARAPRSPRSAPRSWRRTPRRWRGPRTRPDRVPPRGPGPPVARRRSKARCVDALAPTGAPHRQRAGRGG